MAAAIQAHRVQVAAALTLQQGVQNPAGAGTPSLPSWLCYPGHIASGQRADLHADAGGQDVASVDEC